MKRPGNTSDLNDRRTNSSVFMHQKGVFTNKLDITGCIFVFFIVLKPLTPSHFFIGPCCPTNIKLYRVPDSLSLKVYWRSLGPLIYKHSVELHGKGDNLTCEAPPGTRSCDVIEASCGDIYTVLVAPVQSDGTKVSFCQKRTYSGT